MPVLSTPTALTQQVFFNGGIFEINGFQVAAVQDITITLGFSVRDLRGLGTIKMLTAPKRYGWKPSAKAKVKSMNQQIFGALMGSSGPDGSGFDYSLLDGQNVLSIASMRCFSNDDPTKIVEFQFSNAILSNFSPNMKLEDFSESDFEIMAQDVIIVTNFASV